MNEQRYYIIANGTIIDVENSHSYTGSIEIQESKIKRIFLPNQVLPEEIPVIDAKGKFIIPGLIDMHCHIQEQFAPHFLASGVTTVRNTAGNVFLIKNLIHAPIDAPTPRVYSADRMIDGAPGQWGPTSSGNLVTDDPEEARKEVRRQAAAGTKFIKAYGWINRDLMQAVVNEAKKFGLEVSCDLIHSKDLNAIDAAQIGVTWFEHASGFAQALYKGWYPTADQNLWSHINWEEPDERRIKELCERMIAYNVCLLYTSSFDAIMFVGHHGREGGSDAVISHTLAGICVNEMKINGKVVGETEMNAFVAGSFGVPAVFISGDDAYVKEAKETLPEVEAVVVKRAVDRFAAELIHPTVVAEQIREKAEVAVQKAKTIKPLEISGPVTFEIQFKGPQQAKMTTTLPTVEAVDPKTIRFTCDDMVTAYKHMWGCVIIAITATNGVLGNVNA